MRIVPRLDHQRYLWIPQWLVNGHQTHLHMGQNWDLPQQLPQNMEQHHCLLLKLLNNFGLYYYNS